MILGIVGSEAAKFTKETEGEARRIIMDQILYVNEAVEKIVSGGCHLGGIDKWAIEAAIEFGTPYTEYLPRTRRWSGGYKERNIEIARVSDVVVCITVRELPPDYKGMRFTRCYHCGTNEHVKSGGCWTVKYARSIGKVGRVIVI